MVTSRLASAPLLALLLTPALARPAAAQQPEGPASLTQQAVAPAARPAPLPSIGVMADAGLPDGMAASLVFRPVGWLRLHGGGSYNLISGGVRAGATLLPFEAGPSLTVEAGHYFDGNGNDLVRRFAGADYQDNALLGRIGYDYANAHLGLDFGTRRVTFYIHGGMSYIRATVHNLDTVVANESQSAGGAPASGTEVSIKQDPIVRAWTPSAKLGLIVYLW